MEGTNYTLSDLAAVTGNEGFGGGAWWLIVLFLIIFGGNGGLFGNRTGEFGQYATAASQNEILLGQKFDALGTKINQIGDGLCSSTYALNNAIQGEGRAIQTQLSNCCCENQRNVDSVRYDMANFAAGINATSTANTQKILDALCENKVATLQSELSAMQNKLAIQEAVAGVPRINPYMYGVVPYNGCACGCGNV